MIFYDILLKNKEKFGDKIALQSEKEVCTYSQLFRMVMNAVRYLKKVGEKSDKVLLCSYNSVELVVAYFASVFAGKILLFVDPKYNEELKNIIVEYKVDFYVLDRKSKNKVKDFLSENKNISNVFVDINDLLTCPDLDVVEEVEITQEVKKVNPTDPAVIIFTSGTEGLPKGVVNSQKTLLEACNNYVETCHISESDRFLGVTPFFHSYCMGSCMLASLYSGAYIYMMESFVPGKVLKVIEQHNITIFQGVPFMYELMLRNRLLSNLSKLRLCITAGGKIADEMIDRIHALTGVWLINEYGSSETGTIAINYPPNQPYITGKILDGVMVKLENVNKKGIGRLAVKSKGLFLGYWNQEEVCRGYYLTGDLVKMVGKNMILILGRCNDIVSISGLKVNIKEVENIILKYSKVRECLVSKRENSAFGECLEAIIVPENDDINESEIREFCSKHLAKYKIPAYISFTKEIKRSALGKKVYQERDNNK